MRYAGQAAAGAVCWNIRPCSRHRALDETYGSVVLSSETFRDELVGSTSLGVAAAVVAAMAVAAVALGHLMM